MRRDGSFIDMNWLTTQGIKYCQPKIVVAQTQSYKKKKKEGYKTRLKIKTKLGYFNMMAI